MTIRALHFADAHIDTITGGPIDPENQLPRHANDFLASLDRIIHTALTEDIQLVLFAGDAYRSPTPVPTWQREWQQRLIQLSQAHITTLIIPGNHDISNAAHRASSMQELHTLQVPHIHLAAARIHLYTPEELDHLPVQVLAVPWMPLSLLTARDKHNTLTPQERIALFQEELSKRILINIQKADPRLPLILLAHYTVEGTPTPQQAPQNTTEVTLPRAIACHPAFSYTALGHIHQYQDLNPNSQPPVIYPGSIEHVNYGEAADKKGFIIAEIQNHHTTCTFRPLPTRPMYNLTVHADDPQTIQTQLMDALPSPEDARGAMVRLTVTYPHTLEHLIDESQLRRQMQNTLEFQLRRNPQHPNRIRIQSKNISSLTPADLLTAWCTLTQTPETEKEALIPLAEEIFSSPQNQ